MGDLAFTVEGVEPVPSAAVPQVALRLRVASRVPDRAIHSVLLQCRVEIDPAQRAYTPAEQERLFELFDRPERWGRTLRPLAWAEASVVVPAFTGSTVVDVRLPCSRDLEVAATRYVFGLDDGSIPLCLSFRGTAFYELEGRLQVLIIASTATATARLPRDVWRSARGANEPNEGWIGVSRDVFDRLVRYKSSRGLPTWDRTLESLLTCKEEAQHGELAS